MFSVGLNDLDVNSKVYNDRIEDRISCKGCKFYDKPAFDGSLN